MNKLKTWQDLANNYDLVLFNQCINIEDGKVLEEYTDQHECELEDGQEYCECEVYQWYAINISEYGKDYLNKTYNLEIFYSDTLDLYILPVYHFGTGWDCVNL